MVSSKTEKAKQVDQLTEAIFTVAKALRPGVFAAGITGPSAYDIAVTNGFVGTEAEWLITLEGIMVVGPTAPSHQDGRMWLDTSSSGLTTDHLVTHYLTSSTTLTDVNAALFCDGTFDVTLPSAVGVVGRLYSIINEGAGVITVLPDGVETIQGESSQSVSSGNNLRLISNGTEWRIF